MARRERDSAFPVVALALEGGKPDEFLPPEWKSGRQARDLRTPDETEITWPRVLKEVQDAQPPPATTSR
jgi:hypothetical protein